MSLNPWVSRNLSKLMCTNEYHSAPRSLGVFMLGVFMLGVLRLLSESLLFAASLCVVVASALR